MGGIHLLDKDFFEAGDLVQFLVLKVLNQLFLVFLHGLRFVFQVFFTVLIEF